MKRIAAGHFGLLLSALAGAALLSCLWPTSAGAQSDQADDASEEQRPADDPAPPGVGANTVDQRARLRERLRALGAQDDGTGNALSQDALQRRASGLTSAQSDEPSGAEDASAVEAIDRQRLRRAVSRFLSGGSDTPTVEAPGPATTRTVFELSLPLLVDSRYAGDAVARVTTAGSTALLIERLVQLLEGLAAPDVIAALEEAAPTDGYLELTQLTALGFPVVFDPVSLELTAEISSENRAFAELSAIGSPDRFADAQMIAPSWFSAGVSVAASQSYIHESDGAPPGVGPLAGRVTGSTNIGGVRGLNAIGQAFYDDASVTPWARGDVAIFKDLPESAVRFTLGDINPLTTGFQTTPGFGGIGVQRLFAEIQPFRSIRPSGRTRFTLERPSTVELFVNGVPARTLRLEAGAFELSDIPFTSGLNDVVIVVEDDAGTRREIAAFSQFFDFSLLEPGLSEYEFVFGAPTITGAVGNEYDDNLGFTGFYRRGLTRALTVAAHGQFTDGIGMVGAEGVVATPIGAFFAELAHSQSNALGEGSAATVGYNLSAGSFEGQREFVVLAEKREPEFATLDQALQGTDRDYEVRARARAPLFWRVQGALTGLYAPGLPGFADETRAGGTLSRSFGRVTASTTYEWADSAIQTEEHRVLLALTLRAGARQSLRSQFDTLDDRYLVEWQRRNAFSTGSFGLRAGFEGDDAADNAFGVASYLGNRFSAIVEHQRTEALDGADDGGLEQVTNVNVETGLGFAGGRFAVGRAADRGFVIVTRHPSLGLRRVDVANGVGGPVAARTGWFGPALAPLDVGYQPTLLEFETPNIPLGYDIGEGAVQIRPGALSGYKVMVGSDAANTVIGVLAFETGAPVELKGGRLVSQDEPDREPALFFTNRAGRFVAEGLAFGFYAIFLVGSDEPVGYIQVNPKNPGIVDVGTVMIQGGDEQ